MALNRLSRFEACRYEYIDSLCRLGEVLLAFASFVFTMVTFGTPFWLARGSPVDDVEQLHYHMGLWQNCTVLESCKALPLTGSAVPAYLLFSRLFMSVALVADVGAWIVCVLALIQRKARWLFMSAIIYVIQAFTLLLGLSTFFRAYHSLPDTHASWSFTLGWVSFIFSLVCSAYFILTAVYRMHSAGNVKGRGVIGGGGGGVGNSYTPLAQFEESSGSSSENDEKF